MSKPKLLAAYEVLSYFEMAFAVRVFIYDEFVRCGALWLAPGMPKRISLRDSEGNRIVIVNIPEQFQGLPSPTALGDGHPPRYNASPRMIQVASKLVAD